jgi:hypothetical protein
MASFYYDVPYPTFIIRFISYKFIIEKGGPEKMYSNLINESKLYNIVFWRRFRISEMSFDMWRSEIDLIAFEYYSTFEPILEFSNLED